VNGVRHWQSLFNYTREHVVGWMDVYRTASGKQFQYQQKHHYTDNPSIQGMWNSYVNADPAVALAKFPDVSVVFSWSSCWRTRRSACRRGWQGP
jgi:hypothetical protein